MIENKLKDILLSLTRHAITGAGAWLIGKQLITAEGWAHISEPLVIGIGAIGLRGCMLVWNKLWQSLGDGQLDNRPMFDLIEQEGRATPDDVPTPLSQPPDNVLVLPQAVPVDEQPYGGVNEAGLKLIRKYEGCYLKAYRCPAGVWTIGYGHTGLHHNDGSVYPGRTITQEQAEKLLDHDLRAFARTVARMVTVALTANQFAALVSFAFNLGEGNLKRSTMLKELNAGRPGAAGVQFTRWVKCNGVTLKGLVSRRRAELELFNCPGPVFLEP